VPRRYGGGAEKEAVAFKDALESVECRLKMDI
jgi:hypothetical protein